MTIFLDNFWILAAVFGVTLAALSYVFYLMLQGLKDQGIVHHSNFRTLQARALYPLRDVSNTREAEAVLAFVGGRAGSAVGANDTVRLYACFIGGDTLGVVYCDYDAVRECSE